jgi:hypothetical protein
MRSKALLVVLILVQLLYCQDAPQSRPSSPPSKKHISSNKELTPDSILLESYQLSRGLNPSDRAVLLNFLSLTAGTHHLRFTSSWAQENLLIARQLPMDWNRSAIEKNAVMALSYQSPARAMAMLRGLDLPIAEGDSFIEDLRSDGAVTIFQNYWRAHQIKGVPEIRAAASFLGQTGQYPYTAVQSIIVDLAAASPKERTQLPIPAQSLVSDAYTFFQRGSKFEIEDDEFVEFLKTLQPVLPTSLLRQGLELAVDRLLDTDRPHPQLSFLAHIQTDKGTATFKLRQEMMLFELLPLIRQIDPDWAVQIIHRDPALAQAEGNSGKENTSEGVISPGASEPISEQNPGIQSSRAAAAGKLAQTNPEGAVQLAQTITDSSLRAVALANISAVIASSSPRQAKDIEKTINDSVSGAPALQLKDGENDAENTKDRENKLEGLSALVRAAGATGDIAVFRSALGKCFVLGENLFEKNADARPDQPTYAAPAYNILSDLIKSSTSLEPATMTSEVEQIRNINLKAYLLQSLAEALYTAYPDATSPTNEPAKEHKKSAGMADDQKQKDQKQKDPATPTATTESRNVQTGDPFAEL